MSKLYHLAMIALLLVSTQALGQMNDNFETGAIGNWTQSTAGRWAASSDHPIDGLYSLKHSYDNPNADVDFVGTTLNLPNITQGDVTWRFQVKHGYAPSASNRWMVFLMSSATPAQMKTGNLFTGYAVGVNMNESDDKLKMYKYYFILNTQAPPQLLLETSLNWETEFGTTKSAAIEVERTSSGIWKLRVGKDGTFNNLEELGTFSNTDFGTMQNFVVNYIYTSSADSKLWIDNVSATYIPLNTNNRTTIVEQPTAQIASQQITTTDTSMANTKELLRFTIHDQGGDELPTLPTQLTFYKNNVTTSNLNDLLKSVELRIGNQPIPINSINIEENKIVLTIAEGDLSIEEATTKEFSIWGYLKPQANVTDGEIFGLNIPSTNHGWMAAIAGSDFADTFGTEVTTNHTLQVLASTLRITNSPSATSKGAPFTLTAAATDHSENLDKDYSAVATITLNDGNGNLSAPEGATKSLINGAVTWSNLSYSGNDPFTLKITTNELPPAISDLILIINDTTSTAEPPNEQPESVPIPAGCKTNACATNILKFLINDKGGDGLPTIVTNISLFNAAPSNAADWTKAIRFFAIHLNEETIAIGSPIFTKTSCIIPILPGAMVIDDGETGEVTISTALNDKVTDGEILQLKVPTIDHGFLSQITGSTFSNLFSQEIISQSFPIYIAATKLTIKKMPSSIGVNTPFDAEIDAVDNYGNLDADWNNQVTLYFKDANGNLTVFTTSAAGGKALFQSIALSKSGIYSLYSTASHLVETSKANITVADADSKVVKSNLIITPAVLSSIDPDYIPLMAFDIVDSGANDTLPTIISKMIFQVVPEDTTSPLIPLQEPMLKYSDGTSIPISSMVISPQSITINLLSNCLSIANSETKTITLWAKATKENALDKVAFRLKIPAPSHGWETENGSSILAKNFDYDILSPIIMQEVAATSIVGDVPSIVSTDKLFSITFKTIDAYGNLDVDFTSPLSLEIVDIHEQAKIDESLTLNNGLASTNDIVISKPGKYFARIACAELPSSQLNFEVANKAGCDIEEDFESDVLPAWPSITEWKIDHSASLNGTNSLKHDGLLSNNISTLVIPSMVNLTKDIGTFSATIKNGEWNPSSDNNFYLYVSSHQEVSASQLPTGYAIGINVTGDSDTLKVWYIKNGIVQKALTSTNIKWSENTRATILLTCRPDGNQTLFINGNQFTFRDTLLKEITSVGLIFKYTTTRAGLLWVDDISACRFESGPRLITANYIESKSLKLHFSEEIKNEQIFNNSIKIWASGQAIPPSSIFHQGNDIIFTSESAIPRHIVVAWDSLFDAIGNSSSDSIQIKLDPFTDFGSVVINEIMADPTPAIGLPECEYIELLNQTTDTLSFDGWTLKVGNTKISLAGITIFPSQYLTLTTTSCSTQGELANVDAIGVPSFASLTNAGTTILLNNKADNSISAVSYSSTWYGDSPKADGGYSLEKIDASNLSENEHNWAASNDRTGGTPGRENSVIEHNPDYEAPKVLAVTITGKSQIMVIFSEYLNKKTISTSRFSANNQNEVVEITTEGTPPKTVFITFDEQFKENVIYELNIHSGITDLAGNNLTETTIPFAITRLPEWQEIVINELLFNPYPGSVDFVEIYNASTIPFNLKDLNIYRRNSENKLESICRLCKNDKLILPNEYYAFASNPLLVLPYYSCPNPENFLSATIPSMNDDEGIVVLTDTLETRIDEVSYTDKQHYQLLASTEGVSLERVNPTLPPDKSSNWQSAAQTVGFATPVTKNSCFREFNATTSLLSIDPEIFSPNSDGYNDVAHIRFNLTEPGWSATVTVYNSRGREVCKLLNNALIDINADIVWNGLNNSNQQVSIGIYVIVAELFNLNGEYRKEKKAVVVAGKL